MQEFFAACSSSNSGYPSSSLLRFLSCVGKLGNWCLAKFFIKIEKEGDFIYNKS